MVKQKFSKVRRFELSNGFTLIEILVVMAIIGMLAVMVAPNIFNQQAGAQRDAALSQIAGDLISPCKTVIFWV